MNIKRILAFVLSVFMVASLAACAGERQNLSVSVDDKGRLVYPIVKGGGNIGVHVEDSTKRLRSAIKSGLDCNVSIIKDTAVEDYDGNLEILVGDTNREESAIAKQRLIDNRLTNIKDFIVAVIGDKICIQAVDSLAIPYATDWFIQTFCQSVETFEMLTTDYQFIYEHQYSESIKDNTVNNIDLSSFTTVLPVTISYLSGMYAEDLVDFYATYGYTMNKVEDIDPETEYEILIGDCNREASNNVTVEGDNYIITVVGNKIVIKGGNDLATSRGVKAFLDEVKKMSEGKGFAWSDGYTINGKYDANEEGAYTLNWNDEFDGSTVDITKWGDYRFNSSEGAGPSTLGGQRHWVDMFGETTYTGTNGKKLIFQSDGDLVLATQRVDDVDILCSRISTYWTMVYRYGIIEIRGKLAPYPASSGYWVNGGLVDNLVSRFGYSQNRVGQTEIDIVENFGHDDSFASNVHRWWTEYTPEGKVAEARHNSLDGNAAYTGSSDNNKAFFYNTERYGDVLSDNYHIYSCYWDDSSMKFCFDGKKFLDYQYEDNMSVSVHCLMNYFITECHMASPSYGVSYNKNKHEDYYEHKLDYVRIYQSDLYNSQLITAWPEKQETGTSKIFYPDHDINGAY